MSEQSETSYDEIFAMDDGPVEVAEAPQVEDVGQPQEAPAVEAQQEPPTGVVAPATDVTAPEAQNDPRIGEVAKSIRADYDAKLQQLQQQNLQTQQALQQALQQLQMQQQQQPTEPPDPFDPGYPDWMRQQVLNEVTPQVQQLQQQIAWMGYLNSVEAAKSVTPNWDAVFQAADEHAKKYPSIVRDIQASENPGLEIKALGERLLMAQQPVDENAIREKILRELAEQQAKQGALPQNLAPRGVGSGTSGVGLQNSAVEPRDLPKLARKDPAAYEAHINKVFAS